MSRGNRARWTIGVAVLGLGLAGAQLSCSKQDEEPAAAVPSKAGPKKKGGESVRSGGDPLGSAPSAEATAGARSPRGGGEGDTELDSVAMPSAGDCVRQCVARRKGRAVAPEQITGDCQSSCQKECVARCDSLGEARSEGFVTACRKDCDREVGAER